MAPVGAWALSALINWFYEFLRHIAVNVSTRQLYCHIVAALAIDTFQRSVGIMLTKKYIFDVKFHVYDDTTSGGTECLQVLQLNKRNEQLITVHKK